MRWTPEKIEELRIRYPNEDNKVLAKEFGCTVKALAYRASVNGIRKSEEANQRRYEKSAVTSSDEGVKRHIATGTVIVRPGVLIHHSNITGNK